MFPDAGANSGLSIADLPDLAGVDGVFLSGYSLFNSQSSEGVLGIIKAIRELAIPIFFDVASVGTMSAFGRERAISLINGFAGLFMNEAEAEYLTGVTNQEVQFQSLNEFAPLIVIKRGANGAIAKFKGGDPISRPARETKVIDTTGAGDAFAAGFLASWLKSKDLDAAISSALDDCRPMCRNYRRKTESQSIESSSGVGRITPWQSANQRVDQSLVSFPAR